MKVKGPNVKVNNVVVDADEHGYFSTVYFRPLFFKVKTSDVVLDIVADAICIDGSDIFFEFGGQIMEVVNIVQIKSIMYSILTKDDVKACRRMLEEFFNGE